MTFRHSPAPAFRAVVLFAVASLYVSELSAHEGVHEQIARIDALISLSPADATLFLRRGELERVRRQWEEAERDLAAAEALDPSLVVLSLARGRLELDRGNYSASLQLLTNYLRGEPKDSVALVYRATVYRALRQPAAAASDYARAIELSAQPEPEWYRDLSAALAESAHPEAALAALDSGIARLGPVVTLELPAIDLDLSMRNVDSALFRIDRLAAQSQRKEVWIVRRADILQAAGRGGEARSAYSEALRNIQSLPSAQRNRKATVEMERRLQRLVR
ncbi:MAG: hypothetical protein ABI718_18025 [Acidobacteriota bacterium]